MPAPYSLDLRKKIIEVYKTENLSQKRLASRFNISVTTVERYVALSKKDPELKPKHGKFGRPKRISPEGEETIKKIMLENKLITLFELSEKYYEIHNELVGKAVLSRACKKLGLVFKKLSHYAKEQDREDVKKNGKNF
tara:strand:- start:9074 stop:9487 length:414 start_codon:yes stop_codon:yes gene_type:complete